jgi:sugar/nucleoside kinase (ribokinase family)
LLSSARGGDRTCAGVLIPAVNSGCGEALSSRSRNGIYKAAFRMDGMHQHRVPGLTAALARAARQLPDRRKLTIHLSALGNDSIGSQLVDRLRQDLRQLLR